MADRGDVYFPGTPLPPGQPDPHRCVVLSKSTVHRAAAGANKVFATVALIRGAVHRNGSPVKMIMGHSFPIGPTDLPCLSKPSIVETHQLFGVLVSDLDRVGVKGKIAGQLLDDVLQGARLLLQ